MGHWFKDFSFAMLELFSEVNYIKSSFHSFHLHSSSHLHGYQLSQPLLRLSLLFLKAVHLIHLCVCVRAHLKTSWHLLLRGSGLKSDGQSLWDIVYFRNMWPQTSLRNFSRFKIVCVCMHMRVCVLFVFLSRTDQSCV